MSRATLCALTLVFLVVVALAGCPSLGAFGCVNGDDCAQGYGCLNGTCARVCSSMEDCAEGLDCNGAFCVDPGSASGNTGGSSLGTTSGTGTSSTSSTTASSAGRSSSNLSSTMSNSTITSGMASSLAISGSSAASSAQPSSSAVASSAAGSSAMDSSSSSTAPPSSSTMDSSSSAAVVSSSSADPPSSSVVSSSAAVSSSSLVVSSSSSAVSSSSLLMSSSSANPCNGAEIQCNGACTNTANTNAHCNACNTPCNAAYTGGNAQCTNGVCVQSCPAGQAVLNGKCAVFGGIYQTQGMNCGAASCRNANGYTNGCSCPAGFVAAGQMNILDDSNCPDGPGGNYGWSYVYQCIASTTPGPDFGGIYHQHINGSCQTPNPFTGTCSCPAGYPAQALASSHSCWQRTNVFVCNGPGERRTFAGAYMDPDTLPCANVNPLTGACTCPAGSTPQRVRSIYGPSQVSSCENDSQFGAVMQFCRVP